MSGGGSSSQGHGRGSSIHGRGRGRPRCRTRGRGSSTNPRPEPPAVPVPNFRSAPPIILPDLGSAPPMQGSAPPPSSSSTASTSSSMAPSGGSDTRLNLYIYDGCLMPSGDLSTIIRTIMSNAMEIGAYTFSNITDNRLRYYWETFQSMVRWDPAVTDTRLVYKLWRQKAASRYTDMMSHWKTEWSKHRKKPGWDLNTIWLPLLEYWNDPDVKKKSEQCRKNRLSEPGGPGSGYACHKGGSRGAAEVARQIELRTGRPANAWELVENFHYYGNGEYTHAQIEELLTQVQEEASQLSQQTSQDDGSTQTSELDLFELYIKKVGKKHGRIKGLGQVGKVRRVSSGPGETSSGTSFGRFTQADMDRAIAEERRLNEEREARLILQMERRESQLRLDLSQQMRDQFAEMMRQMSGGSGSATGLGGGAQNDQDGQGGQDGTDR